MPPHPPSFCVHTNICTQVQVPVSRTHAILLPLGLVSGPGITMTFSLFELLVVSSAITVRKGESWRSAETALRIWRPITLRISFWISGLVYTFSFHFSHSAKFGSSRASLGGAAADCIPIFPDCQPLPTEKFECWKNLVECLSVLYLLSCMLLW